jgi:hypothetical protein
MNFFKFFTFLTLFNSTLAARFYITREKALVPPITVGSKRHVTFVTPEKKKQKLKKKKKKKTFFSVLSSSLPPREF